MRIILRHAFAALSIAGMSVLTLAAPGAAFAQQAAPAAQEAPNQIALSDKQIENVLAAKPDLDAVLAKIPEGADPDAKTVALLDATAKKHGFANFAEYDQVDSNIGLVLAGFDPQTKKYVGDEAVLKQQIAEVQADKKMPPADKKEALGQLNDALKAVAPLQFPANVQVVAKYYDKLAQQPGQNQ
jgi:hypothetical protein